MNNVNVEKSGGKLIVRAPYHPDFSGQAKKIGGKWSSPGAEKSWVFDARDEARVRALLVATFGADGPVAPEDLLTIRATPDACDARGGQGSFADRPLSLWLVGREVAHASGRDSGARLGDGVVVLSGGFGSGGSVKNPCITFKPRTVFELRDVPRAAAERVHATLHGVTLLDASGSVVAEATQEEPDKPAPAETPAADLPVSTPTAKAEDLVTRLAGVSTTDLAAVLCARLSEAGRGDLAGLILVALAPSE
jgi:hypothetical protein